MLIIVQTMDPIPSRAGLPYYSSLLYLPSGGRSQSGAAQKMPIAFGQLRHVFLLLLCIMNIFCALLLAIITRKYGLIANSLLWNLAIVFSCNKLRTNITARSIYRGM